MNRGFRVRCIEGNGTALAGCFAKTLTATGAVIAWRAERAGQVAQKLAAKFSGTQWHAEAVEVAQ